MLNFVEEIKNELFKRHQENEEENPNRNFRYEMHVLLSPSGIEKFKKGLAQVSMNGEIVKYFNNGDSRFCGAWVFESKEITQDFLIIKKI